MQEVASYRNEEAVIGRSYGKKCSEKIQKKLQENTCYRLYFNKNGDLFR